ncbi:pyridoxamine 5'-phosphate oxidase family protein [Actinokineospora sp. UTMC 2448]|uniref:pyridoxamine 5'-phosphate oxidase family protein n=1 Tax=Actinokineospora sp. UTMC 2448 TaxID=2268449 RepID=UPI0037BFFB44
MWATVPRLLARHRYLVLGTVDPAGNPWVTPVFYAAAGEHRVLWLSSPDSRHSRNIAVCPTVAVTVFDTGAAVGKAEALYLEGTASLVGDHAHPVAVELLNARLAADQQLCPQEVGPDGPLRLYQANVTQHYVLIRGGDPRFDNVTDTRLPVAPPGNSGCPAGTRGAGVGLSRPG